MKHMFAVCQGPLVLEKGSCHCESGCKARLVEQMGDTGLQQNSISALRLDTDVPVPYMQYKIGRGIES